MSDDLIARLRREISITRETMKVGVIVSAPLSLVKEAANLIEQQAATISTHQSTIYHLEKAIQEWMATARGLEAARIAYASEFPPDAEGLPDVGNIHANIRAMKARAAELAIHLDLMTKEFVRMYPLYYYAEPWAHDRNQVLKAALAALSQKEPK